MCFYHRGSRRDTWKLRIFSQRQPQLKTVEKSSPTLMPNSPKLCNQAAVKILSSAPHSWLPAHCQCERRKTKCVEISAERRKPKNPIPFYWNARFGTILNIESASSPAYQERWAQRWLRSAWHKADKVIQISKTTCWTNNIPHSGANN